MSVTRKRFIAGAVCPGCNKPDGVALWRHEGVGVIECVHCGHHQRQSESQSQSQSERQSQSQSQSQSEALAVRHVRSDEKIIAVFRTDASFTRR